MKKRMLCVLALTMVGLTLSTAEAGGGRRSRSYGGGYWGGGYAPYGGWQGDYGQYAYGPTAGTEYMASYQGAPPSPTYQSPVIQTSYPVVENYPSMGSSSSYPVTNAPAYNPAPYYVPASTYPAYAPSYGYGFGGSFGGNCSGGG